MHKRTFTLCSTMHASGRTCTTRSRSEGGRSDAPAARPAACAAASPCLRRRPGWPARPHSPSPQLNPPLLAQPERRRAAERRRRSPIAGRMAAAAAAPPERPAQLRRGPWWLRRTTAGTSAQAAEHASARARELASASAPRETRRRMASPATMRTRSLSRLPTRAPPSCNALRAACSDAARNTHWTERDTCRWARRRAAADLRACTGSVPVQTLAGMSRVLVQMWRGTGPDAFGGTMATRSAPGLKRSAVASSCTWRGEASVALSAACILGKPGCSPVLPTTQSPSARTPCRPLRRASGSQGAVLVRA